MNNLKWTIVSTFTLLLILGISTACGPSPEEQAATAAALTATAATDTPTPTLTPTTTNTPTPTSTPVPYDLSLIVTGEEDAPVIGAHVVLEEVVDEAGTQITDEVGQAFWYDLPGETANFSISAQGYFPLEMTESVVRGINQLTVPLDRDPHGLLPSHACGPGEKLLYIEDFQDGHAQGWHEIEYRAQAWDLISDPETPENIVVRNLANQESGSFLEDRTFTNAVWRMRVKMEGQGQYFLNWLWKEPTEVEVGGEVGDFSVYQLVSGTFEHGVFRVVWPISHIRASARNLSLEKDTWHDLEINNYEGRVEVWLDGVPFFTYQDPDPLPGGKMGIEVRQHPDYIVYFDDIAVCELTEPYLPMPTPTPIP